MTRRAFRGTAALAGLSLLCGTAFGEGVEIVVFGDSTTAPRGGIMVYADRLRESLLHEGRPVAVHNAGVGGDTTERAQARFEAEILARRPQVVVVQFGINDAAVDVWRDPPATTPRVSPEAYRANLESMVSRLMEGGSRVVLMTPNPLGWREPTRRLYGRPPYDPEDADGFNRLLVDYAEAAREVAREKGCGLVDVFARFRETEKAPGELSPDGMHPGERGHALVAAWITEHLAEVDPRFSSKGE
jgi:lysophospholipase L1-like esterase